MAMRSQTQRTLLIGFIGSIAACGAVGVYCLLVGSFGQIQARVLGTTAAIAAASILGLASAIPWERRRLHPIGPVGACSVVVALIMVLIIIWAGRWMRQHGYRNFYEYVGVSCVWGVAFPHIGLLSLATVQRHHEWIRRATVFAILLLATLITLTIFLSPRGDEWARTMGVCGIVVACGTIAVPILHRMATIQAREAVRTVELMLSLTCPRCKTTQQLPAGRSICAHCGLRFRIDIEEEQCTNCGYPLYKLDSDACPECGTAIP